MRSMILVVCLWLLAITTNAQTDNRVVNISPIRRGDGRTMVDIDPSQNRLDTTNAKLLNPKISTAVGGNPHSIQFNELRVQNDPNSMQLSWTAVQHQFDADHFEIEQSSDAGLHWTVIGVVPASRSQLGEIPYSFTYNKTLGDVHIRVAAINKAGEHLYSSRLQSPWNNTSTITITPNPVTSTATLRIGSPAAATVKLMVVNNSGVVVQTRETGLTQGMNPLPVDMSALPKGYYTISIQWPGSKQDAIKFLKQ